MDRSLRVTAISFKPTGWDKAGNADRLEALFVAAAKNKAQLLVSTEGTLEGYVVMDVIKHPEKAETLHQIAEPIDGPYIQRFQTLAKQLKTALCFGFAERIGDEVFNSAVFIGPNGDICGKYHKVQLDEGTHESWAYNRVGSTIRAFDTPLGRVGIVICNDRWNPLIVRTLVLDGAQLILIPSYGNKSKRQNQTVLARARENGVPIVNANVGMNLIISQGEIAAYQWGNNQITTAEIIIPEPPSTVAARQAEQAYLQQQGPMMQERYEKTLAKLNKAL